MQHDLWHKLRVREHFTLQEVGSRSTASSASLFTIFSCSWLLLLLEGALRRARQSLWDGGLGLARPADRAGAVPRRARDPRRSSRWCARWSGGACAHRAKVRFRLETVVAGRGRRADRRAPGLRRPARGRAERPRGAGEPAQSARASRVPPGRPRRRLLRGAQGAVQSRTSTPRPATPGSCRRWGGASRSASSALLTTAPRHGHGPGRRRGRALRGGQGDVRPPARGRDRRARLRPTLQAMAELRELPAFALPRSEELADVLEHGTWVTCGAGRGPRSCRARRATPSTRSARAAPTWSATAS